MAGVTGAASLRQAWAELDVRLAEATGGDPDADHGLSVLGVGGAEIAAGLARLEARTRRSVHNLQRSYPFEVETTYADLTRRSRARGVRLRLVVSAMALTENPLLASIHPAARVGPVTGPALIVDDECVVLAGQRHPSGYDTAWSSTRACWIEAAIEIWRMTWAQSTPITELVDTVVDQRQVEVARLVVAGLTDQAIASRLGVSARTVSHDVHTIVGVVGAASRSQLIRRLSSGV